MTYEDEIKPHREAIDRLNDEIIDKIAQRQKEALAISGVKQRYGKPIIDKTREQDMMDKIKEKADANGLDSDAVERVFTEIIKLCTEAEMRQ